MTTTLLDSIREYAARPWSRLAEPEKVAGANLSAIGRLACADQLASSIREHSPGYAATRQADLEHHLHLIELFSLIHARNVHS